MCQCVARPYGVKDCAGGSGWYFGIIQLSLSVRKGWKKIERCVKRDELLLAHMKGSRASKSGMETSEFPLVKTSPKVFRAKQF